MKNSASDLTKFEEAIGLKFKDASLLRQAFLHRSYLNEHRDVKMDHNERLEFLGDAVLEIIVTDYLFRRYPDKAEGELTAIRSALVNAITLSEVAGKLEMNDYLLLSRGEAKDMGRARQYILANTFESLIGAIYLDQGYAAANDFISKQVFPLTDEIVEKVLWQDAKSLFQEKAQENNGHTPSYNVLSETGPDHNKRFVVGLYIGQELVAEGDGHSKQEAEQAAAQAGLEKKGWKI